MEGAYGSNETPSNHQGLQEARWSAAQRKTPSTSVASRASADELYAARGSNSALTPYLFSTRRMALPLPVMTLAAGGSSPVMSRTPLKL